MGVVTLGVDIGTSGCKTVAVDERGVVVASTMRDYPLYSERPGWSEQDPLDWWNATREGIAALVGELGGAEIAGVGLSGQMHGLVALDDAGRVLRRAILWNDQRCAAECELITAELGGLDALVSLTNNRMLPGFTGGKVRWFRDHEPELYAKMTRLCLPKDYLRYRLTGLLVTDESDASGTGFFDPRTRSWVPEVVEACGATPSMLPRIAGSTEQTGAVLDDIAHELGLPRGVPVFGGGGDAVIQTTSMGIIAPGDVGITLGTAGIVAASTDFCPDNAGARVQVSVGNAPGAWHIMGVSLAAAGAFQWFGEIVAQYAGLERPDFDALTELAAAAPPGSGGLLFLPYLNGERSPHVAPDATAAFVGLTRTHGAPHLARAVIEGAVLNLRRILEEFDELGVPCARIVASGGASRSPLWVQILADVCDREVVTLAAGAEGGAFGAALAAGVGAGLWSDYEQVFAEVEKIARVRPDPDRAGRYDRVYRVHAGLFEQLAGVQAGLATLSAGEEGRA
ncbi:xylulokinase [Leucobacter sp. wl10]|uniref:xylulokinase n=1 Tax=Leucobacter sp. wl10 TaxID=2304677 RepID=UPI000E5A9426|nr:xylulokinase [Leucobacter sp. wl10]RGE20501.1 xylulokinase [Leucobacter sp. wl10]